VCRYCASEVEQLGAPRPHRQSATFGPNDCVLNGQGILSKLADGNHHQGPRNERGPAGLEMMQAVGAVQARPQNRPRPERQITEDRQHP